MNTLQLRKIIEEHLKTDERLSKVFGLGNCAYAFDLEDKEYEIIIRPAVSERTSERFKKQDGPLTQE
jgi:hypothetical protein